MQSKNKVFFLSWTEEQEYIKFPRFLVINKQCINIIFGFEGVSEYKCFVVFFFSVVPKENINIET